MTLGIMQPYLFPYLGYFQLINAVDEFVIHDDVQFIKGGWINRNRILVNGDPKYITLSVRSDSSDRSINEREFAEDFAKQKTGILRQIEGAYRKAPQFTRTMELLHRCFQCADSNVSGFVTHTIRLCCEHFKIGTPIRMASTLDKDNQLRAQERVLAINKVLGADHYVNPSGGVELYDRQEFERQGIRLSFIQMQTIEYPQFGGVFQPALSLIDVMMFNPPESFGQLLSQYELV